MFREMPKVGQIYRQKNGEIFVVSNVKPDLVSCLYTDGYCTTYMMSEDYFNSVFFKLIAQANTWQEAIQSEYFRNE